MLVMQIVKFPQTVIYCKICVGSKCALLLFDAMSTRHSLRRYAEYSVIIRNIIAIFARHVQPFHQVTFASHFLYQFNRLGRATAIATDVMVCQMYPLCA